MANDKRIPLTPKALSGMANYITSYSREFATKNRLFVERLATLGIPIVDEKIRDAKGDSAKGYSKYIEISDGGDGISTARLVVQNKDILFIEFGAGIRYNQGDAHPQAREFGYGVGTYPEQKHAFQMYGWYYIDHGVKIHSYGTEATMPVHSASLEIQSQIIDIAKEVFGFGYNGG